MVGEHTYFEINPHGLSPKELDVRLEGEPRNNFYFSNIFKSVFYKKCPLLGKAQVLMHSLWLWCFTVERYGLFYSIMFLTEALSVSNRASERYYAFGHLTKILVNYCITT